MGYFLLLKASRLTPRAFRDASARFQNRRNRVSALFVAGLAASYWRATCSLQLSPRAGALVLDDQA